MRCRPRRPLLCGTVVVMLGLSGLCGATGCSRDAGSTKATSSSARPSTEPSKSSVPPSGVAVSPAGVTTRIDAPAESTEEEYFQACHAAKEWMDAQNGPRDSLFEPYLAMVQESPSGTAGSWNTRWADLPLARQAGVITAARAAANDECG